MGEVEIMILNWQSRNVRLRESLVAEETRQILFLTLQCEFSQYTSHWEPRPQLWGLKTLLCLRFKLHESVNPLIFRVQTRWKQGPSHVWDLGHVRLEPASKGFPTSCFLSNQDSTSAHSKPESLHWEPYKWGSWNRWAK